MILPDASRIALNERPLQTTLNGVPLWAIITLASCQPPAISFAMPPAGPGMRQLSDSASLWRMSKSDGPSSCDAGPNASGRSGGVIVLEKAMVLPIVYVAPY